MKHLLIMAGSLLLCSALSAEDPSPAFEMEEDPYIARGGIGIEVGPIGGGYYSNDYYDGYYGDPYYGGYGGYYGSPGYYYGPSYYGPGYYGGGYYGGGYYGGHHGEHHGGGHHH